MANAQSNPNQKSTRTRGFASMDPERQRQIARAGGRAAQASGRAHQFNSEEAAAAGRKGGVAVSQNRAHMAQIGAEGGRSRGARSNARPTAALPDHPEENLA